MIDAQTIAMDHAFERDVLAPSEDASPDFIGELISDSLTDLLSQADERQVALDWNTVEVKVRPALDTNQIFLVTRVKVLAS